MFKRIANTSTSWFNPLMNPRLRKRTVIWASGIAILYALSSLELLASDPVIALQNWYVLSVPMVLAAFRYGRRGAAIMSGLSLATLVVIFHSAGTSVSQLTAVLESLVAASTSRSEAERLAFQLGDLRAVDPGISFQRALLGMGVFAAVAFLLGYSVDDREHALRVQERVSRQLRRYFSPHLVEYLTGQEGDPRERSSLILRKEVSVLFADLRDFTPLAETAEPEEVVALLNQFLSAMTEEILNEGGTLDKYIGDGLMAFFGDPGWYPDHPDRAFRAALQMQARMRELHAEWRAQGWSVPGMGIGICTGHVTVGTIGSPNRMEYTVLGSTVNAASRLSALAGAGEILTTRKTYSRVPHLMHGRARERTSLKGFSQTVELVEITGIRALAQMVDGSENQRLVEIVTSIIDDPAYRALILGDPEETATGPQLTVEELARARDVAFLCGHSMFRNVPSAEIVHMLAAAFVDSCLPGTILSHQGSSGDSLYLILEGEVVVTIRDEAGKEQHIASLAAGDMFGEISLLHEVKKIATVRAASGCRFFVLQREDFAGFLAGAPVLRERLEALAANRTPGASGFYAA